MNDGVPRGALMGASPQRARAQAAALAISCFAFYASVFFIKSAMFAAQWRGERAFGVDFKTALASAHTIGYLAGKAPALAIVPKLERHQFLRASLFIVWLAAALVGASAALPPALSVLCIFSACACLSPCWYVLQRSVEGRAFTEAIMSVASLSVIGMSGVAKATGAQMLQRGTSERCMVAWCALGGALLGTVAAVAVGMQPPPSAVDVRLRGSRARVASLRVECVLLLSRYGRGIALSTAALVLCGTVRAFRDFFHAELLAAAGLQRSPSAFASTELVVCALVLGVTACFSRVRDNLLAVRLICAAAAFGGALVAIVNGAWLAGSIGGYAWIVGTGAGTFLAYVPLGTMLYDRLLSAGGEEVTSTPLTLAGDTLVLLATAVLLAASRPVGGSVGYAERGGVEDDARTVAFDQTARFFARLALVCGILVALLTSAGGVALVGAVRQQRRQVRIRHERSNGAADARDEAETQNDERRCDDGGGTVLRGRASGELPHLLPHGRIAGGSMGEPGGSKREWHDAELEHDHSAERGGSSTRR
ncbi:hypothetical protein KFE25_007414 [Diacronema lutheri]|uniref:Uncharacterized protein n=2 Tax=Diacronema lutheri TaxID=2081491 RepID=A0A8J5XHB2_DIALT|nr:hypothetical protein KFE25_007414 [Diacronema lutheri]